MTLPEFALDSDASDPRAPETVRFPLGWILSNGAPPIQYRAITEVARLDDPSHHFAALVYSYLPALRLVIEQRMDGTWNGTMVAVPTERDDGPRTPGTFAVVHRLLELGFAPDSPCLLNARRPLFRLLAEDNDPAFLYDFAGDAGGLERRRRGRLLLRQGAAATLAHLGYENDPRLRGCANRMVQRVREFLESPLAQDPWIRVGNKHVISPDAAPPSISLLLMLSYLPRYRHENHGFLEQLQVYLSQPSRRTEVQQQVGNAFMPQPHLLLGDPLFGRTPSEGDLATTLFWLELFARLGFLDRHEPWAHAFNRLLDARDRDGVWRPTRGRVPPPPTLAEAWPYFPLDASGGPESIAAEVTTRLGIIARACGRTIDLG